MKLNLLDLIKKLEISQILKFVMPGVFFYVVLDMFFKSFGFSISALVLLFLIAAASAFWITRYQYLPIILSVLFSMGSVTFLLSIGQAAMQQYFIVFVSLLFVVMLIGLYRFFVSRSDDQKEKRVQIIDSGFSLNQTLIMFSVFFLSSGIYGIYEIYVVGDIATWQVMLIMLVGIYLSGYYLSQINFIRSQQLELHLDYYKNRAFGFYSFLLAFIMLELTWAMIFLPINHLTFGAIVLAVFYSYWNIIQIYLRNKLTRRIFLSFLAFLIIAVSVIFLTSKLYLN